MGTFLKVVSALLLVLSSARAANILGLFSTPSPSHLIVHMAVVKTLADQGHNITFVSTYPPKIKHENVTVIIIPPTEELDRFFKNQFAKMASQKSSLRSTMLMIIDSQNFKMHYDFINDPRLTSLYDSPNTKFDLMILGFVMNTFQLGVAAKLKVPVIVNWIGVPFNMIDEIAGNIRNPSYVPTFSATIEIGKVMGFFERLKNFIVSWILKGVAIYVERQLAFNYKKAFSNEVDFPTYEEVKRNVSLVFNNYHSHSEGPIRPIVPASIEIGGIQVKESPDPLPKHIVDFFNKSEPDVIYFSLGSNIKTAYIKSDTIDKIFNTLSNLKQNVIWKWDDIDNLPGNSSNILFDKWLPQDDILAHPKTKLFITHAGKGGIAESQYHGVPMLALPIFGDQPSNAQQMVQSGFGLRLDLLEFDEIEFKNAIDELSTNPKYRDNVQTFSQLYRDRPLTARQSVIYWTEYVLRHHGARHLQSPLVRMNYIEANNLDIYVFLLILVLLAFVLLKLAFKFILRKRPNKLAKQPKSKTN